MDDDRLKLKNYQSLSVDSRNNNQNKNFNQNNNLGRSESVFEISNIINKDLDPIHTFNNKKEQHILENCYLNSESQIMNQKLNQHHDTSYLNNTNPSFCSDASDYSTRKFLNILDKINENQSKKDKFYSQIITNMQPENTTDKNYIRNISHDVNTPDGTNSAPFQNINVNMNNVGPLDHILEAHQPNQNDIIFESSKEWTVNQTPELNKEVMPPHLALHLGKMGIIATSDKKRSLVDQNYNNYNNSDFNYNFSGSKIGKNYNSGSNNNNIASSEEFFNIDS